MEHLLSDPWGILLTASALGIIGSVAVFGILEILSNYLKPKRRGATPISKLLDLQYYEDVSRYRRARVKCHVFLALSILFIVSLAGHIVSSML